MPICASYRRGSLVKKILLSLFFLSSVFFLGAETIGSGMKDSVLNFLIKQHFSPLFIVFLIAMLPIFELRLAIPIGIIMFKLPPLSVFLISILGNMVPIGFLLLFLDFLYKLSFKYNIGRVFLEKLFVRTRKKSEIIKKYEELGLILFVAIPLPMTGGWTGAMAASIFGLKFFTSLFCIFIGVVCAGIVVLSLTLLGKWGAFLALGILGVMLLLSLLKKK